MKQGKVRIGRCSGARTEQRAKQTYVEEADDAGDSDGGAPGPLAGHVVGEGPVAGPGAGFSSTTSSIFLILGHDRQEIHSTSQHQQRI